MTQYKIFGGIVVIGVLTFILFMNISDRDNTSIATKTQPSTQSASTGESDVSIDGVTCTPKNNVSGKYEHIIHWIPGKIRQNFWNTAVGDTANRYNIFRDGKNYTWSDAIERGTILGETRTVPQNKEGLWMMYTNELYDCTDTKLDVSLFEPPIEKKWN